MQIEVKNLSKSYEYFRRSPGLMAAVKSVFHREKMIADAVKNISFNIQEGEVIGFLGPNGAGKTTTLKILSGILEPSAGQVRVMGFDPYQRNKKYQQQFSLVMGQKNQLWWDLPAMESFILNKEIYEIPDSDFKSSLNELVEVLGIQDILDIQVRKMSLGQRMKCELAAALLHRPKVLFLDEPTIGLDVTAQKNVREFIQKYNQKEKTTIILTSHYMEDISQLCKRVIIINLGEIVYDGDFQELIGRYAPHKLLTVTFNETGIRQEDVERFGQLSEFSPYRIVLKVNRDQAKNVASAILSSGLPVDDILIDETDVDEVVRKIFREVK